MEDTDFLNFAILDLDMSPYYESELVTLDLFVKSLSDDTKYMSFRFGEGTFEDIYIDLDEVNKYYHVVVDLSNFPADRIYFQFYSTGTGPQMAIDNIRVTDDLDLVSPIVTDVSVGDAPNIIEVTFSEEMDADSFTAADVNINRFGYTLALNGNPIDSGDHKTFLLEIASPIPEDGTYSITIDKQVRSLAGVLLNTNGDHFPGYLNDEFIGDVTLQVPPIENLFYQGFENGDWLAQGWTFYQSGTSTVTVTDQNSPTFGNHHVQFNSDSTDFSAAEVLLDLSSLVGQTNLWLDFQVRDDGYPSSVNQMFLSARNAGDPGWSSPITIDPVGNDYTRFAIDLDQMLSTAGLSLSEPVYLQFVRLGTGAPAQMHLDEVRINHWTDNVAPTMTMVNSFNSATQGLPFTITYDALLTRANVASLDSGPVFFLIDAVYTGTVTKNGVPVIPGTTTISAGETLVYTPTDVVSGANVLGIRAYDGELVSESIVPVWFNFATNIAPILSTINTLSVALQEQPFTVTYAALAAAANEGDANGNPLSFRVEAVSSGTLTKNGVAVVPGVTLLSASEELVWTPAPGTDGQGVNMFSVRAWDGLLASASPVQVKVNFNRPPTLTSMATLTGASEDQPRTITYANLNSAGNEADPEGSAVSFRIESVISGTLTKNGVAVVPGVTMISSGESLVWTPAVNAFGSGVAAFTVKAWDGYLASSSPVQVNVNVTASNHAPVAVPNGPYVVTEGDSLTLSAAGSFDQDLYDVLSYSWDVNGDNVFGDAAGDNPTLTWSQLVALGINDGGVRQVKLRVTDVTHNTSTTSSAVNLQINNGAPSVSVDGPAAVAVGQSVAFDFSATDPSPVDQAGSFFFIIDWNGDGFGDDFLPGTANLSVNHTFTQSGPNQVKVTVTDKDSGVSAVTTYIVNVSGVALVWTGSTNQLVVAGTDGDDVFELEQINPTTIVLHTLMLDGVAVGTSETYYGVGAGVVAYGFEGNDTIIATALTDSAITVYGDVGNDTLRGGGANDQLFGEEDVDQLFGGLGNDLVDGGDGADVLHGEWENPDNGTAYGSDTLLGGEGNDTIYGDGDGGEGAGDSIQGDAGDDLIYGDGNIGKKTATDTIHGGLGNDTIYGDSDGGEAASDLIYGDEDNDTIYADGTKGSKTAMDTVYGGAGDDIIFGDKDKVTVAKGPATA
ncbi:MAG: Ig-like domain-containing protein [Planctomycetota bacterium]